MLWFSGRVPCLGGLSCERTQVPETTRVSVSNKVSFMATLDHAKDECPVIVKLKSVASPSKFQLKMHSFVTSQIFSNVSHTTDIVNLLYYLWSYVYMLSFESRVRVKCVNGCKWSVMCEEYILCTLCLETIALFSLFPQKPIDCSLQLFSGGTKQDCRIGNTHER